MGIPVVEILVITVCHMGTVLWKRETKTRSLGLTII